MVPDAGALKECSNVEQPVLRAYPAGIPAEALADAAERLAGAMAAFEQFDQATRDALAGVRWDRLVGASDMKLAGSDPSAYVEAFAGLLQDDGLGEDAARMGAAVISLALRALLEPIAQEVQAARVDGSADQP